MDPFRLSLRSSMSQNVSQTPEDSVEYWLYTFPDSKTPAPSLSDILACVMGLANGYIWHHQQFRLQKKEFPSPHFYGCSHFGDNLDDEWFIVYLLFELSKVYPNLIIKVVDADGQFLLVEMADTLPDWCTPEVMDNRVFIRRGQLHIIPMPEVCAIFPLSVSRSNDGAELVHRYPGQSLCEDTVVQPLDDRLGTYPSCVPQQYHHAHVYIPCTLALIIEDTPAIVADAVRALCERSLKDNKVCRDLSHFQSPDTPLDLVLRCVRFTKHLYAMLLKHKLMPDKKCNWKLPGSESNQYKAMVLGYKLTAGFEILLSDKDNNTNGHIVDDAVWKKFVKSLIAKGYFKGELEGSAKYNDLLSQAERFYEESCSNNSSSSINTRIYELYDRVKTETGSETPRLKLEEHEKLRKEDDDLWLNVTAADLDAYFNNSSDIITNGDTNHAKSNVSSSDEERGRDIPQPPPRKQKKKKNKSAKKKMKDRVVTFVDDTSAGVEGAELEQSSSKCNGSVNFNPEKFASTISKMLDLNIPDGDNGDSSDMDSYDDEQFNMDLNEKNAKEWSSSMKDYMQAMDKELAPTTISKSFQKVRPSTLNACAEDTNAKRNRSKSRSPGGDSIDFEDDEFTPVDIDRNLVKNMLTGFYSEAKMSQPGPATTLLTGLKIQPSANGTDLLDSDDDPDPDLF